MYRWWFLFKVWIQKSCFVFENGPFENYLPVNQQLQCKECSLFIAWLEELLSGGEIPVLMQCCYQLQAFQDCVGDLWSVDAMCSPLSTALTTKKTKRLKTFGIKYLWTIWFNSMILIISSITSAGHVNIATTRMVNYPMSNIWQKEFLTGERVAVFGLHDFEKTKVEEWRKTRKSEYTIIPVIGGV